jgi:hypothetical protein
MNVKNVSDYLNIDIDKIINIYQYGSKNYGTENVYSDEDYIIIYDQKEKQIDFNDSNSKINATLYSLEEFKSKLEEHEPSILECVFLPIRNKFTTININFNIDKQKLRKSFSSVSSNSWIKCKKKLEQGDNLIGLKSLFHSLRILDFGLQLSKYGKIKDYEKSEFLGTTFKFLLYDIKFIGEWDYLKIKYQPIYNSMKTEFRKNCPI